MLTGRQIREARTLLGLNRRQLAYQVKCITALAIMRAEESEDEPILSEVHDDAVRQMLERAGIVFGSHGVLLRGKTAKRVKYLNVTG